MLENENYDGSIIVDLWQKQYEHNTALLQMSCAICEYMPIS